MGFTRSLIAGLTGALSLSLALVPAGSAQVASTPLNQAVFSQPLAAGQAWPHTNADLKPEPGIIFGVLPNGLRYAIQRNTTPTDNVAMRMMIRAGSMHEAPGQEGIAHLLEHMAFRGSTNIRDGDFLSIMAGLGMRMGPDANAGTSSLFTNFILNLPKGDPRTTLSGLGLMREFASELLLEQSKIDAERNVVLAEERARAGSEIALNEAISRAEVGDHPYANPTIGSMEVIRTVDAAGLRAFYDAYYRPERTSLLIVGDFDPAVVEQQVREQFGAWRGRGPAGGDPAPAPVRTGGPVVQIKVVPGSPANGLRLMWRHPYKPVDPSRAERIRSEIEALGQQAMVTRLRELNDQAGKPYLNASPVYYSDIPGVARTSVLEATYVNDLAKSVDVLIRAQRQIVAQGITKVELDRAIANRTLALQNRVAETPSRETPVLVAGLLNYALSDELPIDPKESLAILHEVAKTVTPAQVTAQLRAHFEGEPTIFYYAATPPPGGEAALTRAVAAAKTAPLATYTAAAVKPWTHTNFGAPGKVVERTTREDLGVTLVKFENGVKLTIKPTTFSKENILVKVRFGYGQLHLPKNALTAADFATTILNGGGLTDMTRAEMGQTLLGKQVVAIASQEDDAYEYVNPMGVPPANLELQMQLFAASFSRAGYRTDDWAVTIRSGAEAERATEFDPQRLYNQLAPPLLHSGDIRWTQSTPEQHASWDPKDAVAFIKPILETFPLEVIMVGDVTVDQAIAATAKTLGALPPRRNISEPADLRDVRFPAGTPTPIDIKHKGRPDQALLVVQWPAADALANSKESQAAAILATVLGSRVTQELRETQGRTYSPNAYDALSTVIPGYGTIGMELTLQPQDIPGAMLIVNSIATDLTIREIHPSVLEAARGPQLELVRRAQQENGFWFQVLNRAHDDPKVLAYVANMASDVQSLTTADIRNAARKWLVREKAWVMTVTPETGTARAAN